MTLPPLAAAREWLAGLGDPVVDLALATASVPGGGRTLAPAELSALRDDVARLPAIRTALDRQAIDGGWATGAPSRRILPTVWMVKALAEMGLGAGWLPWDRAVDFLQATAHTSDGVLTVNGRSDGVLSCYVGIAAASYLLGGRPDLAAVQVEWVLAHQEGRRAGVSRRPGPVLLHGPYLRHRYGGCMAETTCLLGLAKVGDALARWTRADPDPRVTPVLDAIREVFLERELFRRADGSVLPLGSPASQPDRWLRPAFPLDWRTDLVEVLGLVAWSGPPDLRAQPALDVLARSLRAPGGWSGGRGAWPADLPRVESMVRGRPSPLATVRVVAALEPWEAAVGQDVKDP